MRSIQNECKTFFTKIFCDSRTDVYDPLSSCDAQERDCTTPERFLALIIWAARKTKTLLKWHHCGRDTLQTRVTVCPFNRSSLESASQSGGLAAITTASASPLGIQVERVNLTCPFQREGKAIDNRDPRHLARSHCAALTLRRRQSNLKLKRIQKRDYLGFLKVT